MRGSLREDLENWPELKGLAQDLSDHWELLRDDALELERMRKYEKAILDYDQKGDWGIVGLMWGGEEMTPRSRAKSSKDILGAWGALVHSAGFVRLAPGAWIRDRRGEADCLRFQTMLTPGWSDASTPAEPGRWELVDGLRAVEFQNEGESPAIWVCVNVLRPSGREVWREKDQ